MPTLSKDLNVNETFVRILVVDDDDEINILLKKLLKQVPGTTYEVDWVPTGGEAMEVLSQRYDVVLLDYRLEGVTGTEILEDIRKSHAHLPVIMLTARGSREVDLEAMRLGAADYLSKDELTPIVLERAIRYAIDRAFRMTDLEHLTTRLQVANTRLSHKNDELEQFIYMASHDLREPLRQIQSFCAYLKKDLNTALDGRAKQSFDFIVSAANRMDELVAALSRLLRASRKEITRIHVSLNECINRALAELGSKIEESKANITRDVMPQLRCDPTAMAHLYQNLIENSIKYSDKGAPDIHLSAELVQGEWVFGVRDKGCGIPFEHREKIFAPFRRLHRRDQRDGTGIGLTICRKVVESHSGKIWVESKEGEGSHFKFTIGTNVSPVAGDLIGEK